MEAPAPRQHVEWVPKQAKPAEFHDLRGAVRGPKGYKERTKRKLEDMEALHAQDEVEQQLAAAPMDADDGQQAEAQAQASKRLRIESHDGVPYIPVSGRTWKVAGRRAGEVMKAQAPSSWEQKMAAKAARANFQEHKQEAVAAAKEKRKAAALQKKAAEERKKVNRAKSEITQTITSNATLKKLMKNKKQKKLLRKADTN